MLVVCMQSCPELRSESVDYLEQDMTHQPVSQSAETIAVVVDDTADEQTMLSLKSLLTEVVLLFKPSQAKRYITSASLHMLLSFGKGSCSDMHIMYGAQCCICSIAYASLGACTLDFALLTTLLHAKALVNQHSSLLPEV